MVVSLLEPLPSPAITFLAKVSLSHLLLVPEVCNVQLTFRKPYAVNLLVMSNLTLDRSFKVKLGRVSIKVPLSCLLLVLEVCNVQPTFTKPQAANLLVVSHVLLQGLTRTGQHKIVSVWGYQPLCGRFLVGFRGLQCTVDL